MVHYSSPPNCTRVVIEYFQKPGSTTADKSFAIGTIGEILFEMGEASAGFCELLYPHFLNMTQDEDEEVCSNAVFGLGVIMANGGQAMHPYPFSDVHFSIIPASTL